MYKELFICINHFTQKVMKIDEYLHWTHRMKRAELLEAGCSSGTELVMAGSDLWKSQQKIKIVRRRKHEDKSPIFKNTEVTVTMYHS